MSTTSFTVLHRVRRLPWEAILWTAGLTAMACADPEAPGLIDGCLFQWLGVERCPGCGLGHAVAYLFRGDLAASFQAHPFGIPAVVILTGRVVELVRDSVKPKT